MPELGYDAVGLWPCATMRDKTCWESRSWVWAPTWGRLIDDYRVDEGDHCIAPRIRRTTISCG